MEKIGRMVLLGVIAGLLVSVIGTVARLVASSWTADYPGLREADFQAVLVGFLLDLVAGWLFVAAYAIFHKGAAAPRWKSGLLFWFLLMFIGVFPRAADFYRIFTLPGKAVLTWGGAWTLQAFVVAALIILFYPPARGGAAAAPGAKE